MQIRLRLLFTLFVSSLLATAQNKTDREKKHILKDFLNIKAPAINYAVPDTTTIDADGLIDIVKNKKVEYYFDPTRRDFNITEETDTNAIDLEDFSVVEVDEEFNLNTDENDSTWVKIAEYYSIWDNKSVNPYGFDVTKFNDTIKIVLYDSTSSRYWAAPVHNTYLTDDFGPRKYRWHYGVDLELDTGDSVFSVFDGIVRICKYDYGGYGNYIVVRHFNGLETVYGHLSKHLVQAGELVKAGDLVGWGGSTGRSSGPHLHFEIRYQGLAFNPELIFDFRASLIKNPIFELMPIHYSYTRQARKVFFHRVRRGDTVSEIADKYNVTIRQILKLNHISARTNIRPGRRLRIR